jgi:uncharacterized protein YegL
MADFSDFSGAIDLAENPDPRAPTLLLLDSSSSMNEVLPGQTETSLSALNSGLDVLVSELNKDPLAKRRAEISFVTYGSDVTPATAFTTVDNLVIPSLVPSGTTSTGRAIEVGLDALEARKREYKANGIEYYRPMVFLITDGLATDDLSTAIERIASAEAAKKISMFAIGVEGADLEQLSKLTPGRAPVKLQGVKFAELFTWLSASQSAVSASQPGEGVPLPSPVGWAEL